MKIYINQYNQDKPVMCFIYVSVESRILYSKIFPDHLMSPSHVAFKKKMLLFFLSFVLTSTIKGRGSE